MVTLRLVVDLNVEQYGVANAAIAQHLRNMISHAEADGLLTGTTDAELTECLHDVFEIRPGDFGDFELCRPIKGWLIPGGAGSASVKDPSPSCDESVAISVVDGGQESIPAPIAKTVVTTDERLKQQQGESDA